MKRRPTIAIGAIFAIIAIVGATWAISQDLATINNNLAAAGYQTTFTEEFSSPANWITCQTVPKIITVTNNSDVDVAVRIKLDEDWIAVDGTTHLPLASAASGFTMALINFTSNSGWTQDGAYYVYDTDLAPNATTSSLMTGVTLNCDANLSEDADGAYAGAEYHLKATIQTIQADKKSEWRTLHNAIASQVNAPSNINFTQKALKTSDPLVANGNGVNKYTENGADVYYYRGEIDDNNVIWADICWKIVRTTGTGGVKIIYNGEPATIGATRQCSATGIDTQINATAYSFNADTKSPADVGYMYGARITYQKLYADNRIFTFSNDVSKNGNIYTLDTSPGQSISGTWANERLNSAVRYHYFCTDGATSCDNTKIGYIYHYGFSDPITYLPVDGYTDIEAMKDAMFTNTNDSIAKSTIESWFEARNLDGHISGSRNYEDELEDAVFCNDRSYYSGALKGKDESGLDMYWVYHGAYGRNYIENAQGNVEPSLDCTNPRDSFQVSNNVARLKHKIGLATADELTLAGITTWSGANYNVDHASYIYSGYNSRSASPIGYSSLNAVHAVWGDELFDTYVNYEGYGLRPMVSLKAGTEFASGTGLKTDPYIVP